MSLLEDYRDRYENIAMDRSSDGVLEVRLHTDGGPFVWGAGPHRDLGPAFRDIGMDSENRVVLISGTGDVFCDRVDRNSYKDFSWESGRSERIRQLQALVDIDVPVVGVVNGPATIHAELVVLSDIVIAADSATFADLAHFSTGSVPGDGVHLIWPFLLGPNRGRSFLLTGQQLTAGEAHRLGLVAEVVAAPDAYRRGLEIAHDFASRPTPVLRFTRENLIRPFRALLHSDSLNNGLALEALQFLLPKA